MSFFKKDGTARVSDSLPYEELYADGTVLCRDWGLLAVWHVDWPDTTISESASEELAEKVARCFRSYTGSPGDVVYWFVTQRVPSSITKDESSSGFDNMTGADAEIEKYRSDILADRRKTLTNVSWVCCKVRIAVSSAGISQDSRNEAEDMYATFEGLLRTIGARPRRLSTTAKAPADNIMTFLKCMVGSAFCRYNCPPEGMAGVSEYISTKFIEKGKPMQIDNREVQVLTVNAFPGETYPGMLFALLSLPFSFRWVTRWIPKSNWDSQATAKKLRTAFKAGIKGWKAVMYEQTSGEQATSLETQAVTDTEDVEDVLKTLTFGETLGELTSTLVLDAPDADILADIVADARRTINAAGFDFIEENYTSNFPAWLGSLPGDATSNMRRPLVTATNVSHIIPFTGVYAGARYNEYLDRICGLGWPLAIGKLVTNEPYYLNLNGPTDDVGHTFIIGSTGGGKSVLMAFLASQWMRYPKSRVIYLDKDMSFRNLCERTGGKIYVPGGEEGLKFMPLSGLTDNPGRALSWLETAIVAQGTTVTPHMVEELKYVCDHWAGYAPTLQRFVSRLEGHYPNCDALPALRRILSNPTLADLFSGESDTFGVEAFARKTMVEMGPLMNMGDAAVLPVLRYLFDRMDDLFDTDPQPTLLILDEAWKFLSHPVFRSKIKEWLKTLRKKRVFVVMALQNLQDIDDAEEFLTSCHTRIYLPNPDVRPGGAEAIRDLYRKIGVKDGELEVIGYAVRKQDYFISQEEGSALVNFFLDSYQLERLSRDGF